MCDAFTERFPRAEYGPAHIVLSDYNFETEFIESCLAGVRTQKQIHFVGGVALELQATENFLLHLLTIPESQRVFPADEYVWPEGTNDRSITGS